MRNPNGYGSVYKLSGKRRKPYAVRITKGWKDNGQPIYKFLGYFENKKDAALCLANYNKNPYDVDMHDYTVEKIWEIFKERKFKNSEKTSLWYHYSAAYKRLAPLYSVPINKIKAYQIQELIDETSCGLSTKSAMQMLLSQFFEIGIELDICSKNYAKFVTVGKAPRSKIHKPFTEEEIKTLWNNVFFYDTAIYALILIYTGMRPTELLKIKNKDVHIEEKYIIGGIKTEAGKNRTIPINEKILPLVKKLYSNNKEYLATGKSYNQFKIIWDKEMQAMGMSHLPHDGRHTFASLMDTANANKLATKKILGHTSKDITESVYTHKQLDELLNEVNRI